MGALACCEISTATQTRLGPTCGWGAGVCSYTLTTHGLRSCPPLSPCIPVLQLPLFTKTAETGCRDMAIEIPTLASRNTPCDLSVPGAGSWGDTVAPAVGSTVSMHPVVGPCSTRPPCLSGNPYPARIESQIITPSALGATCGGIVPTSPSSCTTLQTADGPQICIQLGRP